MTANSIEESEALTLDFNKLAKVAEVPCALPRAAHIPHVSLLISAGFPSLPAELRGHKGNRIANYQRMWREDPAVHPRGGSAARRQALPTTGQPPTRCAILAPLPQGLREGTRVEVASGHDMTVYDAPSSLGERWSAQESPGFSRGEWSSALQQHGGGAEQRPAQLSRAWRVDVARLGRAARAEGGPRALIHTMARESWCGFPSLVATGRGPGG